MTTSHDATAARVRNEEQAVTSTLQSLIRAYMDKDIVTAAHIYHDEVTWGHSVGRIENKDAVLADIQNRYWHIEFEQIAVQIVGVVAIARTIMNYRTGTTPDVPTSKPHMSVLWVLTNTGKGWQVLAAQSVRPPVG